MVEGRTLVILGYSGRDFDICPVLWSDAEPATVVWLQPSHQDLSPHALEVLSRKKGVWVACEKEGGRLVRHKYLVPDFLRTVINLETEAPVRDIYDAVDHVTRKPSCGGSLEDDRAEVEHVAVGKQETWKPDSYFDPRHLSNWRVQILNRVACPSLGLPLLPDFVGDAAQRFDLESSMYGHIGLYRRSIMVKKRSFKIRAQTAEERLQNRVDLASCWYIYGRPIRAWLQLWSAKCQAERYDNKKILAMIADRRLMMISRVTELIDHGPLRTIAGHLRSRYEDDERIARDQLVVSGNLDGFQSLKHNWERAGAPADADKILPSRHGYANLGLISLNVNANRQWIRSLPWRLSKRKEDAARACIRKAELYGWRHEGWKLRWILLWRGSGPIRWHDISLWWQDFRRTEYPPLYRLAMLVRQLIPTRNTDEPFLIVKDHEVELSQISPVGRRLTSSTVSPYK